MLSLLINSQLVITDSGGLQKEAFRLYKLSPYQTLNIAEKLYLNALISYPRTNSQRLPYNLDCRRIIMDLSNLSEFRDVANKLLKKQTNTFLRVVSIIFSIL